MESQIEPLVNEKQEKLVNGLPVPYTIGEIKDALRWVDILAKIGYSRPSLGEFIDRERQSKKENGFSWIHREEARSKGSKNISSRSLRTGKR